MSNKRIKTTDLEFDQIKENLKEFLRGQSQFSDYDFEGSNLSVLLDILAYNTHYNALYTNMALNEVFLDSASKRDSVVSLAKSIGYTPRSSTCAKMVVDFTVSGTTTTPPILTLPAYVPFSGIKDGVRYTFYTQSDITVELSGTDYVFEDVELIEGARIVNRFTYNGNNVITLPNNNVDTETIKVTVQESSSNTAYLVYSNAGNLAEVTGTSPVYFIKEVDGGFNALEFGDGVIGRELQNGNIITVEYFVSSGTAPNKISNVSYSGPLILGSNVVSVTVTTPAYNGREPEDIEEIRFNAPNMWVTQNRAVTANDYKTILLTKVPEIRDVYVWGGEKNSPPVYGKVFISATTTTNVPLSLAQQTSIVNDLLDVYKVLTVIPEFVDPQYIEVELDVVIYYKQSMTTKAPLDIKTDALNAYAIFNDEELLKFNSILRNSDIIRIADAVDPAVSNVIPRLKLRKQVVPVLNINQAYTVRFNVPIRQSAGSVSCNGILVSGQTGICFIDNKENGDLTLFTITDGVRIELGTVGFVEYSKGIINITSLNVTSVPDNIWKFAMSPSSADVVGKDNNIVEMDLNLLKVNVVAETENVRGADYIYTSTQI